MPGAGYGRGAGELETGALPSAFSATRASYAAKIEATEARIDWSRPAAEVHTDPRSLALSRAWSEAEINGKPERIKCFSPRSRRGDGDPGTLLDDRLTVACGEGAVRLIASPARRQARHERGEFLRGVALTPADARLRIAAMPRYKLTIEYDGTPYVGWQLQEGYPSVQGRLADAIKAFSGEDAIPRGAGRTDTGVHALGQIAHVDLAKDWPPNTVQHALNALLRPDPITVLDCERRADDFDARFSAKARHYLYRIIDRRSPLALERDRAWGVFRPSTSRPWTRRRRSGRASRLHHLPLHRMPGGLAGEDPRPACRLAPWRGHQGRGQVALLPA